MNKMKFTHDQDANAIYVRFSDTEVDSTIALSNTVYIDIDSQGNPVGMEVLNVDSNLLAALKDLPANATLRDLIQTAA